MTTATVPGSADGATAGQARGEAGGDAGAHGPKPLRGKRPGWVAPAVVVGILLAVALAMTLLKPDSSGITDDLDPANPGYAGAQGLANVLRDHGVKLTVVRSQRELLDQPIDWATTVVVTNTIRLSGRTARATLSHVRTAAGVVLLNPDAEVTKGMGLPLDAHLANLADVTAGCPDAVVGKNFRLAQAGRAYTPTASGSAAKICFPEKSTGGDIGTVADESGVAVGSGTVASGTVADPNDSGGAMVTLPAEPGRPPVTLLGDDNLITNGAILDADNAAIALHLFGQTDRLLWYIPTLTDIAAADGTSRSIAPGWFQPGVVLATSAVVLLCLWRGRRLGRLVTEPLPVIVRAVETTESRGRMYRKARDRPRALAVLQLATRRRLAAYLGLSVSSGITNVAAAAAAVSGRPYQEVLDLLNSPAAPDDSSLLERANTLTALEKEVRRT